MALSLAGRMSSFNDRLRVRLPALFLCSLVLSCRPAERERAVPVADRGAGRATSSEATAELTLQGPRVVFLGDSLAAGLHLPADQAFPAVVQRLLQRTGAPFRLVNAGVSGDTTAGGLSRVGWILKQKPRVVVLEL